MPQGKVRFAVFDDHTVTTLDWPPQSLDLNPIENLWSIIKLKRSKRFGLPTCRNELISQVFEIWDEISEELKNNLADSIYRRYLQRIIRSS